MFDKVFISHAKEDYDTAERIYNFLLDNNYSPWLDKKKIQVGEKWDYAINKALKESNFIILLLSSTSVNKRGYVQREFNIALDYSKNMLEDDIYLLPILVDECEIPNHLKEFQWIELDNNNSLGLVLEALNSQRTKYLNSLHSDEISIDDYSFFSIDLNISLPE